MRFSKQAKKIMLVLLRHPESKRCGKSATSWREGETTLKFIVREIEGEGDFYGYDLLHGAKQTSYNRTLLNLSINGYLDRWRIENNEYYYYLTDEGEEKAREIKAEVLNFIEEWKHLVAEGSPSNDAVKEAKS